MNLELRDKTALVTGGSRGIGRAVAVALASEGCRLHRASRGQDDLEHPRDAIVQAQGVLSRLCTRGLCERDHRHRRWRRERARSELSRIGL